MVSRTVVHFPILTTTSSLFPWAHRAPVELSHRGGALSPDEDELYTKKIVELTREILYWSLPFDFMVDTTKKKNLYQPKRYLFLGQMEPEKEVDHLLGGLVLDSIEKKTPK